MNLGDGEQTLKRAENKNQIPRGNGTASPCFHAEFGLRGGESGENI